MNTTTADAAGGGDLSLARRVLADLPVAVPVRMDLERCQQWAAEK